MTHSMKAIYHSLIQLLIPLPFPSLPLSLPIPVTSTPLS